ncbi:hypothetical protein [Variovorax sp. J31P207]|uniref:hypothetical protein n=1 Tax=Variovorax sp. J31P207 TaxID=3053510 RepID=UPI0025772C8C|nr:hypothetical protein [Variovorax sp. J31P207]MDM0066064.1 hypothetical protein [Variovorax sp. J31P207]
MKHEYRYAEHRPHAYAWEEEAASSSDAATPSSSAEVGCMHREAQDDPVWDNWKSVRDVG